jgi:predicted HNH restriction endonuclease
MKLMNFRRFDPHYQETGRVGLTRGNALEEVVWQEFAHDRTALAAAAKEIRDASTKPGEAFHTDASETEDASSLERAWDVLDQQTPPERREYLRELVVRNRRHVADLKALYQGVCQVSGRQVLEGLAGDITEVHHIEWLTRGGSDAMSNMVVLAPDIHAAIHTADAVFDWRELAFVINGKRLPLVVNRHLRPR